MGRKQGAAAVQENAMGVGHNQNALIASYVQEIVNIEAEEAKLRGLKKEAKQRAKDDGLKKMALSAAAKEFRMSEESRQARDQTELDRKAYIKACKEEGILVPLDADQVD